MDNTVFMYIILKINCIVAVHLFMCQSQYFELVGFYIG